MSSSATSPISALAAAATLIFSASQIEPRRAGSYRRSCYLESLAYWTFTALEIPALPDEGRHNCVDYLGPADRQPLIAMPLASACPRNGTGGFHAELGPSRADLGSALPPNCYFPRPSAVSALRDRARRFSGVARNREPSRHRWRLFAPRTSATMSAIAVSKVDYVRHDL